MKITGKTIKEDLARSKGAYLKNEDLRCLATLASALKAFVSVKLPSMERMEIESQFREAFSNVGKIPRVMKFVPKGIPYVKGQEAKLFQYIAAVYKKVQEDIERESLEQMRERKLKIDQLVIKGQKLLDEGNLLEAQRNFREAVTLHVDEDGLYPMLALKLMDKGHHKASLEYLRGAIETSPDNPRAYDLLVTAITKLGETEPGLKVLHDARRKAGDNPLLLCASAQIKAKAGNWAEARADAEAALAARPDLTAAAKVAKAAARKLGG
ncbi:MAG: tetratricopeptide repeat protein [Thermodesulfobacteriota bacterium]